MLLLAALSGAGCGGDDEEEPVATTAPPATAPEPTATERAETATTETAPERERAAPQRKPPPASPEEVPGGAGDEVPIGVDAAFSGRGGRVLPGRVEVIPFIAIRVILRSRDGGDYELKLAGRTLRVDRRDRVDSAQLEGLRGGERYTGTATSSAGGAQRIEILSSAEPGP